MLDRFIQELARQGSCTLTIRARPGARKTAVREVLGDGSIKIEIRAAPEEGRANEELVRFLAEAFDLPLTQVSLLSGQRGRMKVVRVTRNP